MIAKLSGVNEPVDHAIFQNHAYVGIYEGLSAGDIHKKKGLKKSQQIIDHMGSTEIAANLYGATPTAEKLQRENIKGMQKANLTHFEIGKKVRKTNQEIDGTMPENLPTHESINKIGKTDEPKALKPSKKHDLK